jgi:hypothetical protein
MSSENLEMVNRLEATNHRMANKFDGKIGIMHSPAILFYPEEIYSFLYSIHIEMAA